MIDSGVARRAPRNARSCRGSASLPKPWGFQEGMPLWSQDTLRCPRRGGSEANGEREAFLSPRAHGGMGEAVRTGEHAVTGPHAKIL